MSKELKAVIPVAGLGTRMLPATKAIPKEMLPVVDKPLIQYIVNECVAAGIKEIVLVSHSSKNAIENHFDTSFELESVLEQRVKRQLLKEIKEICPSDVTIIQIRQGQAKGLGHAILCAEPVVGDAPFVVLLPDVLLDTSTTEVKLQNLALMMKRFRENGRSQIMVEPVPALEVTKYGIVDCNQVTLSPCDSALMLDVVEKPIVGEAPSNLAIVGRYVFSADIWPQLKKITYGVGGEIQLTDAIANLIKDKENPKLVEAFHISGKSHDCGDKLGYMKAFVSYGIHHPTEGKAFLAWLKQF
ncbi:UTP--glucose-1-phosphate uridylyltransferase GalU [Candidatus Regiella endosymbiont of Tuberolachnus salignus]|uniref:UTP--glucose-1-phosphate uridylyltransferase GalU n=1 Tax=Candidatus Regiella endosymbiont of Tuberolachnus salignus TaxID=3077956 RepID=UPI0030CCE786